MDSDIGEFYADAEPPTGPQPYMRELETVSVRVEDEHALSDIDGEDVVPHDTSRSGNLFI